MNNSAARLPANPQHNIALSPMHWRQIVAIGLCVALNALDGFDVLSISFAAPGIAHDWAINKAALGVVLSLELIGMAVGSMVLGQAGDRIGRRPTVIACLVAMAVGMCATSAAHGIAMLAMTRLFTGLGIGGMLAVTNALVAEYANDRSRSASISLMAGGYPLGAVLGGSLAGILLGQFGWRSVFLIGASFALVLLPLVLALLPEPAGALLQRRKPVSLTRVNRSLRALGQPPLDALPALPTDHKHASLGQLFAPSLRVTSLLLTLAYFCHIVSFYFILKWVPKIVVDMGFAPRLAAGVLVWANIGGVSGAVLFSFLSRRYAVRPLLIAALALSALGIAAFGQVPADLRMLSGAVAISGIATNGAVVLFYALIAQSFPTKVRAGGTGFVIGLGRGGAVLGPVLAGLLFQFQLKLPEVAAIMGIGSLAAALTLLWMRHLQARPEARELADFL